MELKNNQGHSILRIDDGKKNLDLKDFIILDSDRIKPHHKYLIDNSGNFYNIIEYKQIEEPRIITNFFNHPLFSLKKWTTVKLSCVKLDKSVNKDTTFYIKHLEG